MLWFALWATLLLSEVGGTVIFNVQTGSDNSQGQCTFTVTLQRGDIGTWWDWVAPYQGNSRDDSNIVHSAEKQHDQYWTTEFTLDRGEYTFRYQSSKSEPAWKSFSSDLYACPFQHFPVSFEVDVGAYDEVNNKCLFTVTTNRRATRASAYDWVGPYDTTGNRPVFHHSNDQYAPSFATSFSLGLGQYYFVYSSDKDGWNFHYSPTYECRAPVPPPTVMHALIPSYWYATLPEWDRLLTDVTASGIPPQNVVTIANINSGKVFLLTESQRMGQFADYKQTVTKVHAAGIKVYAYVNMCRKAVQSTFATCGPDGIQGARRLYEDGIKDEIDFLVGLGVDGFFMDDTPQNGAYETEIMLVTSYITNKGLEVVHNPGTATTSAGENLLNAVTYTCYRESTTLGNLLPRAAWPFVNPHKFSAILHQVQESQWRDNLRNAYDQGYGTFYATSGGWHVYPDYMLDMLTALADPQGQLLPQRKGEGGKEQVTPIRDQRSSQRVLSAPLVAVLGGLAVLVVLGSYLIVVRQRRGQEEGLPDEMQYQEMQVVASDV